MRGREDSMGVYIEAESKLTFINVSPKSWRMMQGLCDIMRVWRIFSTLFLSSESLSCIRSDVTWCYMVSRIVEYRRIVGRFDLGNSNESGWRLWGTTTVININMAFLSGVLTGEC